MDEVNRLLLKVAIVMLITLLGMNSIQIAQMELQLQSPDCRAKYLPPSP